MFDFLNLASFELPEGEVVSIERDGVVVWCLETGSFDITIDGQTYTVNQGTTWKKFAEDTRWYTCDEFIDEYGSDWYLPEDYIRQYFTDCVLTENGGFLFDVVDHTGTKEVKVQETILPGEYFALGHSIDGVYYEWNVNDHSGASDSWSYYIELASEWGINLPVIITEDGQYVCAKGDPSIILKDSSGALIRANDAVGFQAYTLFGTDVEMINFIVDGISYTVRATDTWYSLLNNPSSQLSLDGYYIPNLDFEPYHICHNQKRGYVSERIAGGMNDMLEFIDGKPEPNKEYYLIGKTGTIYIDSIPLENAVNTSWLWVSRGIGEIGEGITFAFNEEYWEDCDPLYYGLPLYNENGERVDYDDIVLDGNHYHTIGQPDQPDAPTDCPVCGLTYNGAEHGNWCPNCQETWIVCGNCSYVASEGEWNAAEAGGAGHCPSCGE